MVSAYVEGVDINTISALSLRVKLSRRKPLRIVECIEVKLTKLYLYRPGQAVRSPGGSGSGNF
jgi:hypothetical protein